MRILTLTDFAGQRFGRLVVLEVTENKGSRSLCLCQCDCGNQALILVMNLKSGKTKSCTCLRLEKLKESRTTHGQTRKEGRNPVYDRWKAMTQRCENPASGSFHNYGGRGIKICDRWKDFANFYEDMGDPPGAEYSIDRISNDSGYSKENCKWATRKEQSRNKRNNRLLTCNGKTQCISDWAEEIGLSNKGLQNRIGRGWSIERALTTKKLTGKQ